MGHYDWSLGIDWEMGRDFDNRYFLATGFALSGIAGRGNGLASPVNNVVKGPPGNSNVLRFHVFDTTPEDRRQHDTVEVTQVKIEFKGLYEGQPHNSPAAGGTAEGDRQVYELTASFAEEKGFSWPFGSNLRTWRCTPTLELANTGRYLMKATVKAKSNVIDPGTGEPFTKCWEVDPEMLIGE